MESKECFSQSSEGRFNIQVLNIYISNLVGPKHERSLGVPINQKTMNIPVCSDIPKAILCWECCTSGIFLCLACPHLSGSTWVSISALQQVTALMSFKLHIDFLLSAFPPLLLCFSSLPFPDDSLTSQHFCSAFSYSLRAGFVSYQSFFPKYQPWE